MILITGGTGFVGKHLQEALTRRGVEHFVFSSKEFDLTCTQQAKAVFAANKKADTIIHLASYQAAGEFPAKHTADQFRINNLIHTNVLAAWHQFLPHAKLVAIGSSCAYPSSPGPLVEERFMDGEIHGSVYSYAFTKRLLFNGIKAYNDQYKLNGTYLIPATMYGEHDDFNAETAHVCGALVGRFVKAVREHQPSVEIWGDGTQIRDFMYVKDFIHSLLENIVPKCERDTINVGPGRGNSVRELAQTVSQVAGYKGELVFNSSRYTGIKEKFIETNRFTQKYGGNITADLTPGMKRTADWYAANYEALKDRVKFA